MAFNQTVNKKAFKIVCVSVCMHTATAQTCISGAPREKTATNCQYKAELKKSLQREMKDFPLKARENN